MNWYFLAYILTKLILPCDVATEIETPINVNPITNATEDVQEFKLFIKPWCPHHVYNSGWVYDCKPIPRENK